MKNYKENVNKKINNLRKEIENNKNKEIFDKPKINKNSEKLIKNQNKNFLERNFEFQNKIKEKNQILIKKLKPKENNFNNKKIDKNAIQKQLNNFKKWENEKNQKIEKLKNDINNKRKELYAIKKVNLSQIQIENNIERLYKDDLKQRKKKVENLKNILTPTFKPNINKKNYRKKNNLSIFSQFKKNQLIILYFNFLF